jgi:hypothetical protein
MTRSSFLLAPAAALVAGAIAAGVVGSPVDSADAAASFQLSKPQFVKVQKIAVQAVKRSNANTEAIAALKQAGTAGSQGLPGAPGGFDPTKVTRVVGTGVTVSSGESYTPAVVTCAAGSISLAGGWALAAAGDEKAVHVARSYPNATMTGWNFRFAYTGAGDHTVTPYVLCAAP